MQLGPSTSQDFGVIPNEQYQNHHAPPPPPPPPVIGPPVKVNLKVNCLECQVKLKKKLQKMSGVKDVEIVPEQGGTVTVSGSIDSKVLMEVIRINYKKAVLVCPVDKNEPFCSKNQSKKCSCSDDEHDDSKEDDHHHHKVIAAKNNCDNDAGLISEPKNEKKRRMCGMMRCFGKASCPSTAIRPAPRPVQSPSPVPRPLMGFQANGYFPGPPRPGFRPGMLGMPWMPPHGAPPPYGYSGRPPLLPMGSGYRSFMMRSPPRSNPMVHYTNYTDNFRYPYN